MALTGNCEMEAILLTLTFSSWAKDKLLQSQSSKHNNFFITTSLLVPPAKLPKIVENSKKMNEKSHGELRQRAMGCLNTNL